MGRSYPPADPSASNDRPAAGAAPALNPSQMSTADGKARDPLSEPVSRTTARRIAGVRVEQEKPLLFEVAWEVCNKVGGIYTVLRSKAAHMVQRWGDHYTLIGPYNKETADLEFEPTRPEGPVGRAVNVLRDAGLVVHHGRWLISGKPRVALVQHELGPAEIARLKDRIRHHHAISFDGCDRLTDGVVSFSDAVFRLLAAICHHNGADGATKTDQPAGPPAPIAAHFHEWMGGLAIPMIRHARLPIATAFTTHATLLGRYLASTEHDLYDRLHKFSDQSEAQRFGIAPQHNVERACAHGAHVFSTVSATTAEECRVLLGREPDALLPNGLDLGAAPPPHDLQSLHDEYKAGIDRFVMGHFFPFERFDLHRTLYFFTSGRFEPRNKGFDLSLEAMARLNAELKAANLGVTVVFFIVTERPTGPIHPDILGSRGVLSELQEVTSRIREQVGARLFQRAVFGEAPKLDDLVDEYWRLRLRRTQHAFRRQGRAPVITHTLADGESDPVLDHAHALWMTNAPDDPVKIVYHPRFISPVNPLWGMEYDHFVRGCHLGVFPSSYEPWGYTPLECAVSGVPSISSDLAGFGRYVQEHVLGHDELGLQVLARRGRTFNESAADLAQRLLQFCRLDPRERIALRNVTERQSRAFDWSRLVGAYHAAHERSFELAGLPRVRG